MGAAERRPGVALNDELQRTRLYNGRDPRSFKGMSTTDTEENAARPIGAVARPPRPNARPLPERVNEPDAGQSKRGAEHVMRQRRPRDSWRDVEHARTLAECPRSRSRARMTRRKRSSTR